MDLKLRNRVGVIFQPRGADTERPKSGRNQASQQLPESSGKNISRGTTIFSFSNFEKKLMMEKEQTKVYYHVYTSSHVVKNFGTRFMNLNSNLLRMLLNIYK